MNLITSSTVTPTKTKSSLIISFANISSLQQYINYTFDQIALKNLRKEVRKKLKQPFTNYENINKKNYFKDYAKNLENLIETFNDESYLLLGELK